MTVNLMNDLELYKSNSHLSLTSCVLYTYKVNSKIFKTVDGRSEIQAQAVYPLKLKTYIREDFYQ